MGIVTPNTNTEWMNAFLEELSGQLREKERGLVILDGAGFHVSTTLVVPENLELRYLPAYSPELNPIERLWSRIKDRWLGNRIFELIEELDEALCDAWNRLTSGEIRSVCASWM